MLIAGAQNQLYTELVHPIFTLSLFPNTPTMKHLYITIAVILLTGSVLMAQQERPNFLFIAIDDLNTSIGANRDMRGNFLKTLYPDKKIRDDVARRLTPNLDRLAREGRQFVNAMCPSPLCGPSRTSLLTGVATHVSGYYNHTKNFRSHESLQDAVTLPQLLKSGGYFTAGLGKIFHHPNVASETPEGDWPDVKYSWSKWISSGGGVELGGAKLPAMSPSKPEKPGSMSFGPSDLEKEETRDWQNSHFTATLLREGKASIDDFYTGVVETIELPSGKPFFLASGIFKPHLPFFAPKEYFDRFPLSEMSIDMDLFEKVVNDIEDLPAAGKKWTQLTGGKFHEVISHGEKLGGEAGKIEAWKQCVQAYLACVAYADECVGEIMRGLEESPYKDKTIVVLWSDHGFFLGDKARFAKQSLWREAVNCNFIVKLPSAQKKRGTPSGQLVTLSDIYPTIVSMAGLKRPASIVGEDLSALIKNPSAKTDRDYIFVTYMKGNHTLISRDYKYIRYNDGGQEFYDLKNDPEEYHNVAGQPGWKARVEKMDAELDRQLENGRKSARR